VLHWFYEYYIIQADAIIVHRGIIFSKQDVFQMEDVKSIDVSEGFWGKIFNTGTVEFYAFRMHKEIYLNNVPNPYEIAAQIHTLHPTPIGLNWPKQNSRKNQRPKIKIVDTEDLVED
jgi:membrane protein YdbS with pleckstrin-like domain